MERGGLLLEDNPYTTEDVTAVIGVSGKLSGSIYLWMAEGVAVKLIGAILGQEKGELDDLGQSGIAEMANVMAGTAGMEPRRRGHRDHRQPAAGARGPRRSSVDGGDPASRGAAGYRVRRSQAPRRTPRGSLEMRLGLDLQPGDDRLFTDKSMEQIERIEQGLLELERDLDAGVVNEVFRAGHTLKGSAATIGHRRMAELTHAMEDLFGGISKRDPRDVKPFADVLLTTIDVLRALVAEVAGR